MADPATMAGATFAGLNAVLSISKHYFHFKEVPAEVSQLQTNVIIADNAIRAARRLQRLDGMCLGEALIADADSSIECVEKILDSIRETLEGCRRDMQLRGTVGTRQRTLWLLWSQQEFTAKLATLTNALAALNRDVTRMELAVRSLPAEQGWPTGKPQDHGAEGVRFPRGPTMRRTMHNKAASPAGFTFSDNASQVTLVEPTDQIAALDEELQQSESSLYLNIPYQMSQAPPEARTFDDSTFLSPCHGEPQTPADSLRRAITAPERPKLPYGTQGHSEDQFDVISPQQSYPMAPPPPSSRAFRARCRSNFI